MVGGWNPNPFMVPVECQNGVMDNDIVPVPKRRRTQQTHRPKTGDWGRTVTLRRLVQETRLVRQCLVDGFDNARYGCIDIGSCLYRFDRTDRVCECVSVHVLYHFETKTREMWRVRLRLRFEVGGIRM